MKTVAVLGPVYAELAFDAHKSYYLVNSPSVSKINAADLAPPTKR